MNPFVFIQDNIINSHLYWHDIICSIYFKSNSITKHITCSSNWSILFFARNYSLSTTTTWKNFLPWYGYLQTILGQNFLNTHVEFSFIQYQALLSILNALNHNPSHVVFFFLPNMLKWIIMNFLQFLSLYSLSNITSPKHFHMYMIINHCLSWDVHITHIISFVPLAHILLSN